jgi:hypothetical protein
LTNKILKSSQIYFLLHTLFFKGSLARKKLDMELEKIFGFFLEGCLSSSLKGQFILFLFFSKHGNDLH